jgi:hypothetical protein
MKNTNKYRKLENAQKKIRVEIMNMIIDKKSVVSLNEISNNLLNTLELEESYIKQTLDYFEKNNIMVVDEDNYVNFIYPVSAHETMHKVTLQDGRKLNAMCAIDALGAGLTFNQDIAIDSVCNITSKEINIKLKDNKLHSINNDDLRILHINLDKHENWAASC